MAVEFGDRLGEVREDDGDPQPDRDTGTEARGQFAAAGTRTADKWFGDRDGGRQRRADLDHEHHGVAPHESRVELAQGTGDGGPDLGEGEEERLTGRIYRFRRGVTRYPTPSQ